MATAHTPRIHNNTSLLIMFQAATHTMSGFVLLNEETVGMLRELWDRLQTHEAVAADFEVDQ